MRILVLGVGNILLTDEAIGVRIVEALEQRYILPDYVDEFFSSSDKNLVRSKDNNLEAFYLATPDGRFEALNNKGEYIFIRNSVPGLSSVCIPYHD